MKLFRIELFLLTVLACSFIVQGQNLSSQLKSIQTFDPRSGITYTEDAIYRTDDDGVSWYELTIPKSAFEKIVHLYFLDERVGWKNPNDGRGWAVLADRANAKVELAVTNDWGRTWIVRPVNIPPRDLVEADYEGIRVGFVSNQRDLVISIPYPTSTNFREEASYISADQGLTWELQYRISTLSNEGLPEDDIFQSGNWTMKTTGECSGFKIGCVQTQQIFTDAREITPPQIKLLAETEKQRAMNEAVRTPMFALPPGGTTRISLNRGFDQCNAPTAAQMQTWWNNSPLYDMNIYMSGRNRACSAQPNLNAAWVNQVTAMGWGLIPTVVGYQSPCTASTTTAKLSYDPATAEQQGHGEADIAVADANNLGLTTGSILYYDMERYDPPNPDTLGCRTATIAFLKGWTDRVKELGYKSGVYGSPFNAQNDWVTLPPASKMDVIWMARWDNVPSVWTYVSFPTFPTNEWANHQRIKQWQGPHNETWGGITFNIDGDISDAPVAGVAIARNKVADFDGDGKTDISVWRPDTGVWYALTSSNGGFSAISFGLSTDVFAPGDYDGDGKTDEAVYRPSDGVWHVLTKAGFYSARQFGISEDIPVAADYNGDGKTDMAVFRPSNGVWYIANSDSQGTYSFIQFGLSGDKPVPGDYDGDGKADVAVWRPSTGVWYVLRSSDGGFSAVAFGLSTDRPAEGDFDGDGKYDYALYRDGTWYLLQSTAGFGAFQFGTTGDIPSTGDYDGDGKADAAVFRPSTGVWYIQRSTGGYTIVQFGLNGDRPIPNAYLPQ